MRFNPRELEVRLLPRKRSDRDPGVVRGQELLLHPCILQPLLPHPPFLGEKWVAVVLLSCRFPFLHTGVHQRHIPWTEGHAREGGEDLLPRRHSHPGGGHTA